MTDDPTPTRGGRQCGTSSNDLDWAAVEKTVASRPMSASGYKRTFWALETMSAFGGKADVLGWEIGSRIVFALPDTKPTCGVVFRGLVQRVETLLDRVVLTVTAYFGEYRSGGAKKAPCEYRE